MIVKTEDGSNMTYIGATKRLSNADFCEEKDKKNYLLAVTEKYSDCSSAETQDFPHTQQMSSA